MTLGEAQEYNVNRMHRRHRCVACGQHANPYKVVLSASMVEALSFMMSWFLKHPGERWMHVRSFPGHIHRSRTYMKLAHWGFAEPREKESDNPNDEGKKDSGEWRILDSGTDFLNLDWAPLKQVHGHCWVYATEVVNWSPCMVDVLDVVTDHERRRFNLAASMIDHATFQELQATITEQKRKEKEDNDILKAIRKNKRKKK